MDHPDRLISTFLQIILVVLFIASLSSTIVGFAGIIFDRIKRMSNKKYKSSLNWFKIFLLGLFGVVLIIVIMYAQGVNSKLWIPL